MALSTKIVGPNASGCLFDLGMKLFQSCQRSRNIPSRDQSLAINSGQVHNFRKIFARRNVDIGMIAERPARKRIETLQQLEIVRHHKNDTDVRNKRNRTDFVHKVAIDLGSLQANDASEGAD